MNTNNFLQKHVKSGKAFGLHRSTCKSITCSDGFTISIQASSNHYCSPRDNYGPYDEFELGFPSQADDLIAEYAEDVLRPTETVYAYVPVDTVLALLEKHGGVVEENQ